MAKKDKKYAFSQERMFGRVAKLPISITVSELVEMDFVDLWFLSNRDTCPRFSIIRL